MNIERIKKIERDLRNLSRAEVAEKWGVQSNYVTALAWLFEVPVKKVNKRRRYKRLINYLEGVESATFQTIYEEVWSSNNVEQTYDALLYLYKRRRDLFNKITYHRKPLTPTAILNQREKNKARRKNQNNS